MEFINLGLPSGTLWATENEAGYHQFDEAVKTFGDMLPSADAWQELFDQCRRKWDDDRRGYVLTGPNGKRLFLPADGWQDRKEETKDLKDKGIHDIGNFGIYWSSSPYDMDHSLNIGFASGNVNPTSNYNRLVSFSVRLCKKN